MLSAVILTLNEEKHLPDCLASLGWADEILVFDSFSTDTTQAIAAQYGARFLQHPFANYAAQRNAALAAAANDWVLFVDADERIPPALAREIKAIINLPQTLSSPAGWWIPRHNYLFGRLTLRAGWYPDYQLRLLKRSQALYDADRQVHELVRLSGAEDRLETPLVHLNYETVAEFIQKQRAYTRYDAGILFDQGRRARPQNFVLQPLRQFWWRFVTLQGWRDGLHGLRLSLLMGYFQWALYRELGRMAAGGSELR